MIEYLGYCAGAPLDVTASAQWISTDNSVAVSIGPGLFQMQAPGATVIYSISGGLYSPEAFGYRVAAAGVFQQIGVVAPEAETTAGLFIPNATFELTSAAGTQTCQQATLASAPCYLWSDLGPTTVRVSAPGYTSVQQSITPTPLLELAVPISIIVHLSPSP